MLTELECKNFEEKEKNYKKFDGEGMFLLIKSDGSKYWRLKYTYLYWKRKINSVVDIFRCIFKRCKKKKMNTRKN